MDAPFRGGRPKGPDLLMRSFEIFVASPSVRPPEGPRSTDTTPPSGVSPHAGAEGVLDLFIGGANVTALAQAAHRAVRRFGRGETHAGAVLRDLGAAVVELSEAPSGKRIVRFYDEPWELCVEREGGAASLSVYRGGPDPVVAIHDRVVPFAEVLAGTLDATRRELDRPGCSAALVPELRRLSEVLGRIRLPDEQEEREAPLAAPVAVEGEAGAPLSFGAELLLRPRIAAPSELGVERTDVHALLFRGAMRATVRDRTIELGGAFPFLFAERLAAVGARVLDAWERGAAHHVRAEAGGVLVGARLSDDGTLAFTLGGERTGADRPTHTFPALTVPDLVLAAVTFGRGVVRAILRRDRSQSWNLRLSGFRRELRETEARLREACRDDSKTNPVPESYRAFAPQAPAPAGARGRGVEPPSRLRYTTRWNALVPGIDLRSTFLCGDRFIVGAAAETFCLERATGEVLWRVATEKATSVVTPGGIARLRPDGELLVHDFGTGEVTLRTWLAARTSGPPSGAVVNVPGLPRLLIVTEGERHLVALDLASGEPRWRLSHGRGGLCRMKRAGRLLYYTSGDSALTAVDVVTGAIVWRARDRLRFRAPALVDHDVLYAVAGGSASRARLHAIDAFSGQPRWSQNVAGEAGACTVEGAPLAAPEGVVTVVRAQRGVRLALHRKERGELAWATRAPVAPLGTSWLVVDDLVIGNAPTGELVAIETATGETRYRHVLGTMLETDVPRRLEPVLRSGALFVPHANVHILRPRDGAEIGVIGPVEAIPDLLRVDERCDVYVAEESGHVVSFGAGARLSLVKG